MTKVSSYLYKTIRNEKLNCLSLKKWNTRIFGNGIYNSIAWSIWNTRATLTFPGRCGVVSVKSQVELMDVENLLP